MTHFLHTDADMMAALDRLAETDPRLAAVRQVAGTFSLRRREGGFAGLCSIVCGQQLSTASAAAIRNRLFAAFEPFHHDAVRAARTDRLKRLGLSMPKIRSIKAIGKALSDGQIDLEAVGAMDADAAHERLVALHGVGPWTADIYLLFCLGHSDAWPAGDLALQEAARIAFGLRKRPDVKQFIKLAEPWRPWRGAVAHLLWAYYHVVKRRDGAPEAAASSATVAKKTVKRKLATRAAPKRAAPKSKKTKSKKTTSRQKAKRNGR